MSVPFSRFCTRSDSSLPISSNILKTLATDQISYTNLVKQFSYQYWERHVFFNCNPDHQRLNCKVHAVENTRAPSIA